MDILFLFCIITLGQGVFLTIYIVNSNKAKLIALYLLAAIALIEVLTLYDEVFLFFNETNFPVSLYYIGTPLMIATGPLILAFIHFTAKPKERIQFKHWLHLIPTAFIIFIALQNYHLLPPAEKAEYIYYFKSSLTSNESNKSLLEIIINNAFRVYLLLYLLVSWLYLKKSKKLIRSTTKESIIKILIFGVMLITISSVILEFISFSSQSPLRFAIFLFVFSSHIFLLTYIYILPPTSLSEADKYKRSGLKDQESNEIKIQLKIALEQDKIYKDMLLTSDKLANSLGTNTHYLSQLINSEYKKTYNDLINEYRIQEAKILLLDTESNFAIEEIAQKAGFGSSSTFFRAFKKFTDKTPSQFRKNGKPS